MERHKNSVLVLVINKVNLINGRILLQSFLVMVIVEVIIMVEVDDVVNLVLVELVEIVEVETVLKINRNKLSDYKVWV